MRYVGDFPILYKGEKQKVRIVDGVCSEIKTVEPVVHCEGGDVIGGIWVYDKQGEREAVFGTSASPNDVFASYRAVQLLLKEKEITREGTIECCLAVLNGPQIQHGAQRAVIDRIGGEEFGMTVSETVPNAQDALQLLFDSGIEFNGTAVTEEVRAGRLQYTKSLEDLGVEDSRVVDQRDHERASRVQRYVPAVRKFLKHASSGGDHSHHAGCPCEKIMLATINGGIDRSLEREDVLLGMGIANLLLQAEMTSPLSFLTTVLRGDRPLRLPFLYAAQYLANEYQKTDVDGYIQLLEEALKRTSKESRE